VAARGKDTDEIVVRRYGLLAPLDWREDCEDHLRRMSDLWNRCVEIDLKFADQYRATTSEDPAVAELEGRIAALTEGIDQLDEERRARRKTARSKIPTPNLDERIAAAQAERKALTPQVKEARTAAREAKSGGPEVTAIKERLKAAKADRQRLLDLRPNVTPDALLQARQLVQAIKDELVTLLQGEQSGSLAALDMRRMREIDEARTEAVDAGLFWSFGTDIVDSYKKGRAALLAKLKTWKPEKPGDQPPQLQFHRYDGTGGFFHQIQGGMTVGRLAEHAQVRVIDTLPPGMRQHRLANHPDRTKRAYLRILRIKLYAGETGKRDDYRSVSWPIIMHRDIPDDTLIKTVRVTRRRRANQWLYEVIFTCTRPAARPAAPVGDVVSINVGWRKMPDHLRVATVRTTDRLWHVQLPQHWLDQFDYLDGLRSQRDDMLNALVPVWETLDWTDAPEPLAAIAERIRNAKKIRAGSVAALVNLWKREYPDWHPDELPALEAWRRRDKSLWLQQENLRAKLLARRKDHYQRMARLIVADAGTVRIEVFDLAKAARLTETNPLYQAARRYRQISAPSEFRMCLSLQADKLAVPIELHEGVSTWECHVCAHRVRPERPQELRQQCPSCLTYWDQDANATAVVAARAAAD
jgi:uncharacterized small protein (DUF1192 family)